MTKRADQPDWKNLKVRIEAQDPKTLVSLIGDLFALSEGNRNFIGARLTPDEDLDGVLKRYKKIISEAIYPDLIYNRNARIDFAKARKAVSDFKRACSGSPERILDLMIHYVEVGTRQANHIGIDYESYYTSLESMFSSVIRLLAGMEKKHAEQFLPRLKKIVKNATDGWGYQETLEDILDELTESGGQA